MKDIYCITPRELNDKGYITQVNHDFFEPIGLLLILVTDPFTTEDRLEVINISNKDLTTVKRYIKDDFWDATIFSE